MPKAARWFALSALVVFFDYISKIAVLGSFSPGESRAVTAFFNLVLVFNKGAAFSFLATAQGWQTFFFAAIAVVASFVVSFLIVRNERKKLFCAGLALILGGALGLHSSVREKSHAVISLSKLTLPHELARVVFLEQLYRAATIMRGKKYHY